MMTFAKYHGSGNDFILIDDREQKIHLVSDQIRRMCDRHFGIGADGLILIRKSKKEDFEMLYFNSDGMPGSMCGNGGRCAVAFASALGIVNSKSIFSAFDGNHQAQILSTNPFLVKLEMTDVNHIEVGDNFYLLDTGSPHFVQFRESIAKLDVVSEGRQIRNSERFNKAGVNVNFVEAGSRSISLRTYERGVENETLSCGTGITASVLAAAYSGRIIESPCEVKTSGGNLKVHFKKEGSRFYDIWLEGPAEFVFTGATQL